MSDLWRRVPLSNRQVTAGAHGGQLTSSDWRGWAFCAPFINEIVIFDLIVSKHLLFFFLYIFLKVILPSTLSKMRVVSSGPIDI